MNITILGNIIAILTRKIKENLTHALGGIVAFTLFVAPTAHRKSRNNGKSRTYCDSVRTKETAFISLLVSVVCIALIKPIGLPLYLCSYPSGQRSGLFFWHGNPNDSSVVKDLRTSLALQIFTASLIFIYFKQVSLISPLANLLVSLSLHPL